MLNKIKMKNPDDSSELLDVMRVLSLSHCNLLQYLPYAGVGCYVKLDGGDDCFFLSQALIMASQKIIAGSSNSTVETGQVYQEIICVIEMLLELSDKADYMWVLDKKAFPIQGPFDVAWSVLRRLAKISQKLNNDKITVPQVDYLQIIQYAGYRPEIVKNI